MRVGGHATGLGVGNGAPAASFNSTEKSRMATSIRAGDSQVRVTPKQPLSATVSRVNALLNGRPATMGRTMTARPAETIAFPRRPCR